MFQGNVYRLGGKYSNCVPDDAEWQDLRDGSIVTITKGERRYDRRVFLINLNQLRHFIDFSHYWR